MENYSEELGYWYLRLNGFFPIGNFVLHSIKDDETEKMYNADADLIAIRPPNALEEIKGVELRLDSKIVSEDEKLQYIYVYCEVKTSTYDIPKLFPAERIEYVKKRCGLLTHANSTDIRRSDLKQVLIAIKKKDGLPEKITFIHLNDVISFIKNRFKDYDEYKYPSRMFFKSSLIQFLIHEARTNN